MATLLSLEQNMTDLYFNLKMLTKPLNSSGVWFEEGKLIKV